MTRLIVATGFVIAFCAGTMLGLVIHRPGMPPPPGGPGGRASWIASQLDLSPDQASKMHDIWSDMSHHGGHEQGLKRGQIRHDCDDAVAKLVRPEDKTAYDAAMKDARDKIDALDGEGRKAFQQAVEKTKAILTPEQRIKYETLIARPPDGRPATRPGDDGHGRPAD